VQQNLLHLLHWENGGKLLSVKRLYQSAATAASAAVPPGRSKKREKKPPNFPARDPAAAHAALAAHWLSSLKTISF
jgi:hypothetical protein